ncbi:MAG: hypothetical protein GYA34_06600 [Chloroflexi bacterium]|nr:hypothetical protein [Chloroflexota bacterium]
MINKKFKKIITGIFEASLEAERAIIKCVTVSDERTAQVKEISCSAFSIQDFSKNRISFVILIV